MSESNLDSPQRYSELESRIKRKQILKKIYSNHYQRFADSLKNVPGQGKIVELGSGGGFVTDFIPECIQTDVIKYPGINLEVDATKMPFEDNSVKGFLLINVLHHIHDAEAFFNEAIRCLVSGGKIYIIDQHIGYISYFFLKFLHHEHFDMKSPSWVFNSSGPLSGANGALPWIIFFRDRKIFEQKFGDSLKINFIRPHTPLLYWLSGGLKWWTLIPSGLYETMKGIDRFLTKVSGRFGSFMDIEIIKKK